MTIIEKLKLNHYQSVALINCPNNLQATFQSLHPVTEYKKVPTELIINFVADLPAMQKAIESVASQKRLTANGYFYLAYPKLKNNLGLPGVHRDSIFPYLKVDEDTGIVDGTTLKFSRMVSLDDDFTLIGLKYAHPLPRKNTVSQRVGDYVQRLPELKTLIQANPIVIEKFEKLTPGYQRDWARYVFGVKQPATQHKHLIDLKTSLLAGYPTMTHYRKRNK